MVSLSPRLVRPTAIDMARSLGLLRPLHLLIAAFLEQKPSVTTQPPTRTVVSSGNVEGPSLARIGGCMVAALLALVIIIRFTFSRPSRPSYEDHRYVTSEHDETLDALHSGGHTWLIVSIILGGAVPYLLEVVDVEKGGLPRALSSNIVTAALPIVALKCLDIAFQVNWMLLSLMTQPLAWITSPIRQFVRRFQVMLIIVTALACTFGPATIILYSDPDIVSNNLLNLIIESNRIAFSGVLDFIYDAWLACLVVDLEENSVGPTFVSGFLSSNIFIATAPIILLECLRLSIAGVWRLVSSSRSLFNHLLYLCRQLYTTMSKEGTEAFGTLGLAMCIVSATLLLLDKQLSEVLFKLPQFWGVAKHVVQVLWECIQMDANMMVSAFKPALSRRIQSTWSESPPVDILVSHPIPLS